MGRKRDVRIFVQLFQIFFVVLNLALFISPPSHLALLVVTRSWCRLKHGIFHCVEPHIFHMSTSDRWYCIVCEKCLKWVFMHEKKSIKIVRQCTLISSNVVSLLLFFFVNTKQIFKYISISTRERLFAHISLTNPATMRNSIKKIHLEMTTSIRFASAYTSNCSILHM